MALYRVKARWSGFTGAPGYSIFHFDTAVDANTSGAEAAAGAVRTFFNSVSSLLPDVVTITVENSVEVVEESNGELQDVLTVAAQPVVVGQHMGNFSTAVGACVTWQTGSVRKGRRVRGRTFLVPLAANAAFAGDGTLASAALTQLANAAQALHQGGFGLQVFARPSAPGATDGGSYSVTGARISDKTAVLRSRRD